MVKRTKGNTILCIEDEEDIRTFACKVLELEGYHCIQAKIASEALQILAEEEIDLILLDLKLDEPDGWEILKNLKKTTETSHIPLIVCTASPAQPQKNRALELGAVDYLVKPLSANVLREAVFRVFPV